MNIVQKNFPSLKPIKKYLGLSQEKAVLLRKIFNPNPLTRIICLKDLYPLLDVLPKTSQWYDSLYNKPTCTHFQLEAINEVLEGYGVEVIGDCNNYPPKINIEYINMGDTYISTICYFQGRFIISSWGDIVEKYNL